MDIAEYKSGDHFTTQIIIPHCFDSNKTCFITFLYFECFITTFLRIFKPLKKKLLKIFIIFNGLPLLIQKKPHYLNIHNVNEHKFVCLKNNAVIMRCDNVSPIQNNDIQILEKTLTAHTPSNNSVYQCIYSTSQCSSCSKLTSMLL